jgi:hypothetical protein
MRFSLLFSIETGGAMTSPTTEVSGQAGGAPGPLPGDPDAYLWPRPEDFPNLDELVLEDGKPVDNIFSEIGLGARP